MHSAQDCDFRDDGIGTDFVNGLRAIVVVYYHKQNFRNAVTPQTVFDNLVSRHTLLSGTIEQSFQDYADRDLDSSRFLRMLGLLCIV